MGIEFINDNPAMVGTISLDSGDPPILTSPEEVNRRASMAQQGLEKTVAAQPLPTFVKAIQLGQEAQERQKAAAALQANSFMQASAAMTQYIAQRPGNLTPGDLTFIQRQKAIAGNPQFDPKFDPRLVFETNYADSVTKYLDAFATSADDSNFWNVAKKEQPKLVDAIKQSGYVTMAQSAFFNTLGQDLQEEIKNQNPWFRAMDTGKLAWPILNPYLEAKLRGNTPGVGITAGGGLGANLDAQAREIYKKPFNEQTQIITDIVTRLRKDNPQVALAWLEAIRGQSSEDRFNNNMNTVMNLSDLGILYGVARGFFKRGGEEAVKAVKDMATAAEGPTLSKANTAAAAGDLNTAATERAAEMIAEPPKNMFFTIRDQLGDWMTGMANNSKSNPAELSKARTNILYEQWINWRDNLLDNIKNVNKMDRIPLGEAKPEDLVKLQQEIRDRNPEIPYLRFSDPYKNPYNNTWYVDGYIGFPGGTLWMNPRNANQYMLHMGILGGELEQQGAGYMIKLTKPIAENGPFAKDFIANQERLSAKTPGGFVNSVFGKWRTGEDTFSTEQRVGRKPTVYSPSIFRGFAEEIGKAITDVKSGKIRVDEFGELIPWYRRSAPVISRTLAKKEWREFQQMLVAKNKEINPVTNKPGMTFDSPGEMDHFYHSTFNRPASWAEHQAYQSMTFLNEMDRVMREIAVNRNQARLFGETHTIVLKGAEGGAEQRSSAFAGMRLQKMPKNDETVAIFDQGTSQVARLNKLTKGVKEPGEGFAEGKMSDVGSWAWYNQKVKTGEYKLLEIYDPEARPLEGFSKLNDQKVRYVLTRNVDTEPLRWTQVNRTGGIHHMYEYDNYAKQAIMRQEIVDGVARWHYEGDRALFGVDLRAMGKQAVDNLNEFLRLMREGKQAEAKAYANSGKTPFEWADLVDKMRPKVVDGKYIPPRLDPNEPIMIAPKNRSIAELDNGLRDRYNLREKDPNAFVDGTKQGSAARAFQVEYTGQRDAENFMGLKNEGTFANPIFKLDPADMVDPITSLNRSLSRIVKQNFVDDYKISAVQAWLKEAMQFIKDDASQVFASPFYYFKNAARDMFVKGDAGGPIDKAIDTLLANKIKIDQLVGTPHWLDTKLHGIAQDIADSVYTKTGFNVTPAWLLPTIRDPFQYARSFTFNAYLGLFAVPQLLIQNMTYASIFAISPKAAVYGSVATILHQMGRLNRHGEIMTFLDKTAGKFGWKPGEFTEAFTEGNRTGFFNVAGEFGPLDMAPNVIKNGADRFLSWGQLPFREGERNVRLGAWYTAFKEWRGENPTATITDAVRNKILDRADLLYGNMSTASNSFLHTGILSTATQFYAYNIRLAELFMSGTGRTGLTLMERNQMRARMIGVYSLLFGVPGAFGLSGVPAGDWFRQQALEGNYSLPVFGSVYQDKPYVVGQNALKTMFMEGIPSMLMNLATGNWYNFGSRYGVQGFTALRDILYSDAPLYKILFGASGTLIGNTLKNSDGLMMWISSFVDGKGYKPKIQDAVDFLKEIQTVNRGWMVYTALTTGKWINKNSETIEDVSNMGAWGRFFTGLSSQEYADQHVKGLSLKERGALAKYGEAKFDQEIQRAFLAASRQDYAQADEFMKRAIQKLEWSGWPVERMGAPFARAYQKNEPVINRIDKQFYLDRMNGVPLPVQNRLFDTYSGR